MIGYLVFWGILCAVMVIAEFASMQLISIWFAVGESRSEKVPSLIFLTETMRKKQSKKTLES